MEDNPYSKIMEMAQPQNAGLIMRRGTVRSISPLVIDVAGITISGDELYVNSDILFAHGDTVIMLTEDDQTFYVLCKVVGV